MAKPGWDGLTESEKTSVIAYAKQQKASEIIVGRVIEKQSKKVIMLDETAWKADQIIPRPVESKAANPKCESAAARMWTGVRVYRDEYCEKPFATILGGKKVDGQDAVVLKFDTGEIEVKYRSAVRDQTFVMADDPALERRDWRDF